MLKNDVRYILKRVIVAILIAFILFFLKSNNVLAATVTVSSSDYQTTYRYCSGGIAQSCGSQSSTGYKSAGTWSDMPTQPSNPGGLVGGYYVIGFYNRAYANLTTGNTYTVTFRNQFNPKTSNVIDNLGSISYNIYGYANNTLSDNYINDFACSSKNISTHDYAVQFTCTFSLNTNVSYILIRNIYFDVLTPSKVTVSNFHIESSQNETGAINEQTSVIKQEFQRFMEIFRTQSNKAYEDQTDNSDPSIDVSGMSNITGLLPAGPIDSLLAIPLTLIQLLVAGTSGTCSNLSFNFFWDMPITLPCVDAVFWSHLNATLLLFLSDVPAVLIFILWAKSIYKRVERAVSFESSVDDEWGGV